MRLIDADELKLNWYQFDHRRSLVECIDEQPTIKEDKWISVKSKLPEEHETEQDIYDPETLGFVDTERSTVSDLVNVVVIDNETEKRFVCDDITTNGKWVNFQKELYTVTHWMTLPKLPQDN